MGGWHRYSVHIYDLSNGKLLTCQPSNRRYRAFIVQSEIGRRAVNTTHAQFSPGRRSAAASAEDSTRARILQVALELFATQGFAATSTRELSERLGFTKPALYYHFRTKDDLLAALIDPVIEELTVLITNTPLRASAAARRTVLDNYAQIVGRHLDLVRMLTQDPSVTRRPASAAHANLQAGMMRLLAGHDEPSPAERARARAALGAIRAGLLNTDVNDPWEEIWAATLTAARAALGIPFDPQAMVPTSAGPGSNQVARRPPQNRAESPDR